MEVGWNFFEHVSALTKEEEEEEEEEEEDEDEEEDEGNSFLFSVVCIECSGSNTLLALLQRGQENSIPFSTYAP